ncbi:MAG: hypothetical protein RLO52_23065 [Sandaracinaceae bacterium]
MRATLRPFFIAPQASEPRQPARPRVLTTASYARPMAGSGAEEPSPLEAAILDYLRAR